MRVTGCFSVDIGSKLDSLCCKKSEIGAMSLYFRTFPLKIRSAEDESPPAFSASYFASDAIF